MITVLVDIIGLGAIGAIVWYFWLSRRQGTAATVGAGGVQEAFILVKGGYSPDTVRVASGSPVRLMFNRQEADPCSERVVIDAFGVSADLPEGDTVPVEFTPTQPGEFEFACQMGMLRGKLIVT